MTGERPDGGDGGTDAGASRAAGPDGVHLDGGGTPRSGVDALTDGAGEVGGGMTAADGARTDGGTRTDAGTGDGVEAADERPTVPARQYSSFERGSLSWLLQRVTAAFLVVVLAFHFFLLHFVNHAFEVTFAGTSMRMRELGYSVTMVLFLVTATFHGVNGVYNALVNQGLDGRQKTAVKWVLVLAGVGLVVQGIRVAVAMAAG